MAQQQRFCACGREAIDVLRVAAEDGLLLVAVCEECSEDGSGVGEEQLELFGLSGGRPLTAMPSREHDPQALLPLDAPEADEEHDAA